MIGHCGGIVHIWVMHGTTGVRGQAGVQIAGWETQGWCTLTQHTVGAVMHCTCV
jgi:hypothetical protein